MNEQPAPDTARAKNASLVALAQYIVAVDGTKVCEGEARENFAIAQAVAALILIDTLTDFAFSGAQPKVTVPGGRKLKVSKDG